MLVVFLLKLKYKYKAKIEGDEDLELCFVKKVTTLTNHNEYDSIYIIPTISISFNYGISIVFNWLTIYYGTDWSVVTFKDEDEYAEFIQYKHNKNES